MRSKFVVCCSIIGWMCGVVFAQNLHQSRQMVVVRVPDSVAVTGTLEAYELTPPGTTWQLVLGPFPVTVGRKGLAWGHGLHPDSLIRPPLKHEGDGKSPQGVFGLGGLFGYDTEEKLLFTPRLPYIHVTPDWICVDDTNSNRYNRLTSNKAALRYVHSYERMLRQDDLYKLGITVNYNTTPVHRGHGSCIFLHLWRDEKSPTAGCTAMSFANMVILAAWLDASRSPMLVQMTEANYRRYASAAGLP